MTQPDQYRRLRNSEDDSHASTPVFDPVLASGQADAEAGGASEALPSPAPPAPDRRSPESGQTGLRLPMGLWVVVAVVAILAFAGAAIGLWASQGL
jgi:hypothetical protein